LRVPVLIAGGGLAGLACARELQAAQVPYLLVEREAEPGGLCRSVRSGPYTFDYTGHFLHFKNPRTRSWVQSLPGLRLKERRRHAAIYSRGGYSEYPYQENTYGLPTATARENLLGYLEAALQTRFHGKDAAEAEDFLEWSRRAFGLGITKNFMEPYNAKLWKFPLDRLTTHWMGRFVPRPQVKAVVEGALRVRPSAAGYNATFLYPEGDGIQALPRALAQGLPNLACGTALRSLDLGRREARLSNGARVGYDRLVSTLPLPTLAALTEDLPAPLRRQARGLKATSVVSLNYGLRRPDPVPYSWVYFPEPRFDFHRAGCLSACVAESAPKSGSTLYVEVSYRGPKPDVRALGRRVLGSLKSIGWIKSERDVAVRVDLDLPGAYVVYDAHREKTVPGLLAHFRSGGVESAGRWGLWEYGSMESALEQGRQAAVRVRGR